VLVRTSSASIALSVCGRLHGERVALLDFAADEIGQPAVGEGNIRAAFEHRDLGGFIEPPRAGGTGSPGRHAADNYQSFGIA
jgi:hypothetical protein